MMRTLLLALMLIALASPICIGQTPPRGACDVPVAERTSEFGCYFVAAKELGALPAGTFFWHLYTYPDLAAAKANVGPRGMVAQSFGKFWVYSIEQQGWSPKAGERVAVVGPLPHEVGKAYTARYMEAVFGPNTSTRVHTHSGAEAWYVLGGAQCLETPEGITVVRAGEGSVVREGPPMVLSSVGTEKRISVLLVLHDSSKPWSTLYTEWKPQGKCPQSLSAAPAASTANPAPTGLFVKFKVKPGKNTAFEAAFREMQAGMREQEPGALYYDLFVTVEDPQTYVIMERYKDAAAVTAHGQTEHMRKVLAALRDLMDGPPVPQQLIFVSAK
jgi:quinol monooxygenase YgiN/mannose-6-phosphate isomerase-like protein (cupin superfamily)